MVSLMFHRWLQSTAHGVSRTLLPIAIILSAIKAAQLHDAASYHRWQMSQSGHSAMHRRAMATGQPGAVHFVSVGEKSYTGFKGAMTLCAFEAAARAAQSVGTSVMVHTTYPSDWKVLASYLMEEGLPVQFPELDVTGYMKGTPLEVWYTSGAWRNHSHMYQDLADGLRLAILQRDGGIYADMDLILTSSGLFYIPTFVVLQNFHNELNNNLFAFPRGHPFLTTWMSTFLKECTANSTYGTCGPWALTDALDKCRKGLSDYLTMRKCPPSLSHELLSPFRWQEAGSMLDTDSDEFYKQMVPNGLLAFHWFHTPITWQRKQVTCLPQKTFLRSVAEANCPLTVKKQDVLQCSDTEPDAGL